MRLTPEDGRHILVPVMKLSLLIRVELHVRSRGGVGRADWFVGVTWGCRWTLIGGVVASRDWPASTRSPS